MSSSFPASQELHAKALNRARCDGRAGRSYGVAGIERPQCNASERRIGTAGEKQTPAWRRVRTRQAGELALEALKAQVDLEPLCIFDEERPRQLDVAR